MSPAQELRTAAARMRELAEKATPGPWLARVEPGNHDLHVAPRMSVQHQESERSWVNIASGVSDETGGWNAEDWLLQGDAEHIASWHPAVVLAVADWLEGQARDYENYAAATSVLYEVYGVGLDGANDPALTVARTFLGGAP